MNHFCIRGSPDLRTPHPPSRVKVFRNPAGIGRLFVLFILVPCSFILLFAGCSSRTQLMHEVRTSLRANQNVQAYSTYQKKVEGTSDIDKLINLGLLAFEAKDYGAAHRAFDSADKLAEERQTKSVTKELAGIAVSDRVRAYQGTGVDRAWIHYYRALVFLAEGDKSAATVEGRRLAQYLSVNARESKHAYKDDAFLQYFSGALYESFGQPNDAWISYKRAREVYGNFYGLHEPSFLCPVTHRIATQLGVPESEDDSRACEKTVEATPANYGRVIVLAEAGIAPQILQQSLTYPILKYDKVPNRQHDDDWDYYGDEVYQRGPGYHYEATDLDYLIHVALPYYPDAQGASSVTRIVVKDSANHEYSGELCTDLNAILRQDLQDRMPSIAARAIARAILKYTATKAAEKAGDKEDKVLGKLFGLAVNAAGALSEAADTRSWETLPEKIFVADLSLPPGEHDLRVLFQDELGGTLKRHDLGRVTLDPGEIVIVRVRSMN